MQDPNELQTTAEAYVDETPSPANARVPRLSRGASLTWSIGVVIIGVLLVFLFFQWDKDNQISNAIRNSGGWGILLSIFLMALFCVIPVPSEFLMVMNMKVYGVWWGIFYTWVGAMIGGLTVFWLARFYGRHLLEAFVSPERMDQVNEWMLDRGPLGLLMARLVPLPFIVVNYAAGVLRSVTTWNFLWTTAVGLLPYDLGAALVFLGVSKRFALWLVIGGMVVVAIWVGGYLFNRHVNKAQRWAH